MNVKTTLLPSLSLRTDGFRSHPPCQQSFEKTSKVFIRILGRARVSSLPSPFLLLTEQQRRRPPPTLKSALPFLLSFPWASISAGHAEVYPSFVPFPSPCPLAPCRKVLAAFFSHMPGTALPYRSTVLRILLPMDPCSPPPPPPLNISPCLIAVVFPRLSCDLAIGERPLAPFPSTDDQEALLYCSPCSSSFKRVVPPYIIIASGAPAPRLHAPVVSIIYRHSSFLCAPLRFPGVAHDHAPVEGSIGALVHGLL